MNPTHFVYLIRAPRPTFVFDMTADERDIMVRHQAWLGEQLNHSLLLAGPALDGAFGIALYVGSDAAEAAARVAGDPAVVSGLCTATLHPVHAGLLADVLRAGRA